MEKKFEREKITLDKLPEQTLVHKLESSNKMLNKNIYILGVIIIIFGVISGYFLTRLSKSGNGTAATSAQTTNTKAKLVVGSSDTKLYPDSAEGTLEAGGINGEGTHKLVRPGGDSQTVYLTSSSLDLNQFTGKKVRVWGQTFAGKKAGWLMDVGKVEQLE